MTKAFGVPMFLKLFVVINMLMYTPFQKSNVQVSIL